ncbi:MAG: histidine--tRNA ligase [Bacteroidota bacterium]|nr:histidine--tRNA ligase [Bacteroidota bacterium]
MKQKPSIPKGTRDFTPGEMLKRNYIFNTIRTVFENYAYLPIETPAMEKLSTLMGKYGEEGDRLLFKILNSGDFLKKVSDEELTKRDIPFLANKISEKGLRYDLTVPFARFVVQHQNDIVFPFKRYQIQPVWRADRPQKGRYREFFQCDADVIGSKSMINEFELVQIMDEVFNRLNMPVTIKINNRKLLQGIMESMGIKEKFMEITVIIDKLDKIGETKVKEEFSALGISDEISDKLMNVFLYKDNTKSKLDMIKSLTENTQAGTKGIEETEKLWTYIDHFEFDADIELDLSLARGLDYYTGAIFEVVAQDVDIGSICGGGRYDDLTGIFGLEDLSGVGISFGADRIYDVLEKTGGFPETQMQQSEVLFLNFGAQEEIHCLPWLSALRKADINAEIYPDPVKIKKQMKYADKKKIPWVIILGKDEMKADKVKLKNMHSGEEHLIPPNDIVNKIRVTNQYEQK